MTLKAQIKTGQFTLGSWITLAHPAIAEIMCKAGFDWLAVDLEHSVITIREAEELIRVIDLCGVAPLVRLTSNNADLIKRVMDAGAQGVIVPMVNSEQDAKSAVQAVHYPPTGTRGVGLARAQGYGTKFQEYYDWQQDQAVMVVQIEHIEAVHNIESILAVEGVDGYILGPYDLSGSMGIPGQFDHPDFLAVLDQVRTKANKMGVPGGIHIIEPDQAQLQMRMDEGYRFVAYSLDIRMLDAASREACNMVRGR